MPQLPPDSGPSNDPQGPNGGQVPQQPTTEELWTLPLNPASHPRLIGLLRGALLREPLSHAGPIESYAAAVFSQWFENRTEPYLGSAYPGQLFEISDLRQAFVTGKPAVTASENESAIFRGLARQLGPHGGKEPFNAHTTHIAGLLWRAFPTLTANELISSACSIDKPGVWPAAIAQSIYDKTHSLASALAALQPKTNAQANALLRCLGDIVDSESWSTLQRDFIAHINRYEDSFADLSENALVMARYLLAQGDPQHAIPSKTLALIAAYGDASVAPVAISKLTDRASSAALPAEVPNLLLAPLTQRETHPPIITRERITRCALLAFSLPSDEDPESLLASVFESTRIELARNVVHRLHGTSLNGSLAIDGMIDAVAGASVRARRWQTLAIMATHSEFTPQTPFGRLWSSTVVPPEIFKEMCTDRKQPIDSSTCLHVKHIAPNDLAFVYHLKVAGSAPEDRSYHPIARLNSHRFLDAALQYDENCYSLANGLAVSANRDIAAAALERYLPTSSAVVQRSLRDALREHEENKANAQYGPATMMLEAIDAWKCAETDLQCKKASAEIEYLCETSDPGFQIHRSILAVELSNLAPKTTNPRIRELLDILFKYDESAWLNLISSNRHVPTIKVYVKTINAEQTGALLDGTVGPTGDSISYNQWLDSLFGPEKRPQITASLVRLTRPLARKREVWNSKAFRSVEFRQRKVLGLIGSVQVSAQEKTEYLEALFDTPARADIQLAALKELNGLSSQDYSIPMIDEAEKLLRLPLAITASTLEEPTSAIIVRRSKIAAALHFLRTAGSDRFADFVRGALCDSDPWVISSALDNLDPVQGNAAPRLDILFESNSALHMGEEATPLIGTLLTWTARTKRTALLAAVMSTVELSTSSFDDVSVWPLLEYDRRQGARDDVARRRLSSLICQLPAGCLTSWLTGSGTSATPSILARSTANLLEAAIEGSSRNRMMTALASHVEAYSTVYATLAGVPRPTSQRRYPVQEDSPAPPQNTSVAKA